MSFRICGLQPAGDHGHLRGVAGGERGDAHQELLGVPDDDRVLDLRVHLAVPGARGHLAERGDAVGGDRDAPLLPAPRHPRLHGREGLLREAQGERAGRRGGREDVQPERHVGVAAQEAVRGPEHHARGGTTQNVCLLPCFKQIRLILLLFNSFSRN